MHKEGDNGSVCLDDMVPSQGSVDAHSPLGMRRMIMPHMTHADRTASCSLLEQAIGSLGDVASRGTYRC